MRNKKYTGHWWLESEEDNKIAGELILSRDSMPLLQLQDAFFPSKPDVRGSSFTIYGESEGNIVTLQNCSRESYSSNIGSYGTSTQVSYVANYCTIGYPFINEDIVFDELFIEFEGLNKWAWADGLEFNMNLNDPPLWQAGDEIYMKYTQMESLSTNIDGTKISFNIKPQHHLSKGEEAKIEIKHRFKIEPSGSQVPLDNFFPTITHIQNFVSFAAGGSVAKKNIKGKIDDEDVDIILPEEIETDIQSHPKKMIIHLSDITDKFDQTLQNWFEFSEEYKEVIDMYSGSAYNPKMYPRNELQNYAHVLESYHRKKYNDGYMHPRVFDYFLSDIRDILKGNPENVYPATRNNLRDMYDIPDPMVQSLSDGALKYSNEYSLKNRLAELVNDHHSILVDLPYSIEGNVRLLKDTRNYFAHYTDELEEKAVTSGTDLQKLVWGAKQLIEVCILKELGMTDKFVKEKMERMYENKFVQEV